MEPLSTPKSLSVSSAIDGEIGFAKNATEFSLHKVDHVCHLYLESLLGKLPHCFQVQMLIRLPFKQVEVHSAHCIAGHVSAWGGRPSFHRCRSESSWLDCIQRPGSSLWSVELGRS